MIGFASPAWTLTVSRNPGGARGFDVQSTERTDLYRDGSCAVIFSGMLYNRAEIDARHGTCASDAQRVLCVFRSAPNAFAHQLRGIFAFVIRDEGTGDLHAGRDRLGVMPLFFAAVGDAFVFSPSFQTLNSHERVSREPNAVLLGEHLADLWTSRTETYTAAVERVLPSTVLHIAGARQTSTTYWDPSDGALEHDPEEVFTKFRDLLGAAVARFMQIGKAGLFLSGGVDSISVAAAGRDVAARTGLPLPTALSLFYRDSDTNEEAAQTFVARGLGLPFLGSTLDEALGHRSALENLIDRSRDWPVPMWNLWLPGFLSLGEMGKRAGCEVLLTGGGGDEWLGVGPYRAADLLRSLRLVGYAQFVRSMQRSYSMPFWLLLRNVGWMFGAKQLIVSARNRVMPALGYDLDGSRARRALPGWLAPDPAIRRRIIERLTQSKRDERLARNAAPSLYEFEGKRSLRHPLVVNEIENRFAMGEATATRFFEPYWDADLIDLLYRTPPEILSRGGVAKGLVHRLVSDALPSFTVPKQKKIALGAFYRARIRAETHAVWNSSRGLPALARMGLVDETKFSAIVDRALADPKSRDLWLVPHVLSAEAWARSR